MASQDRESRTMKLSEALDGVELEIVNGRAVPAGKCDPKAEVEIAYWSKVLALWWTRSPMSVRECESCAEISIAGTGKKRKCWKCGEGQMVPLKPEFVKKRPRGRKVKLPNATGQ